MQHISTIHKLNTSRLDTSYLSNLPMEKIVKFCVKCEIWKRIHEKCESMITDSWHTFSNGSGQMLLTRPILARATPDWPRYKTTNWPKVVPQKAHGAKISKMFCTSTPPWEVICVNPRFLGSISHVAYRYQLWVLDEIRFCIIFLMIFDALKIVEQFPN